LIDLPFNDFTSTGSTNPRIARTRQLNAGGVGGAENLFIFGYFYSIGRALVDQFNSVSLRHISIIGFNSPIGIYARFGNKAISILPLFVLLCNFTTTFFIDIFFY
jgi:hypothetical protein